MKGFLQRAIAGLLAVVLMVGVGVESARADYLQQIEMNGRTAGNFSCVSFPKGGANVILGIISPKSLDPGSGLNLPTYKIQQGRGNVYFSNPIAVAGVGVDRDFPFSTTLFGGAGYGESWSISKKPKETRTAGMIAFLDTDKGSIPLTNNAGKQRVEVECLATTDGDAADFFPETIRRTHRWCVSAAGITLACTPYSPNL